VPDLWRSDAVFYVSPYKVGRTIPDRRKYAPTERKKKNHVGSETPPTSIKEKETLWSKVPYVYPHLSQRKSKHFRMRKSLGYLQNWERAGVMRVVTVMKRTFETQRWPSMHGPAGYLTICS